MLTYATGVLGVIAVAVAWLAVQLAWKRAFPGKCTDPDALASRGDCHGCKSKNAKIKGDIPLLPSEPKA